MSNPNYSIKQAVWAKHALIGDTWQKDVLFTITASGHWENITPNMAKPVAAQVIDFAIPGIVNAHSHAFQRAFAGLSEFRQSASDDFWSWRESMYIIANKINPRQIEDIAAFLYLELLRGGFTHVCEFNYICRDFHHVLYAGADSMEGALLRAAKKTGIGITLMPVLYERSGFTSAQLNDRQLRFAADVNTCIERIAHIRSLITSIYGAQQNICANPGLAIHSLRAARAESVLAIKEMRRDLPQPIHIHVSEQTKEVDDSIASSGKRPIEWLLDHRVLDSGWALVHATHTVASEIRDLGNVGATAVICPTTEANLGDGIADIPGFIDAGVPLTVGTDSHINRSLLEELRWLEYVQRLALRKRNIFSAPPQCESSARKMYALTAASGAKLSGHECWGFRTGARADLLAVNENSCHLVGIPEHYLLDALVFSTPARDFDHIMVGGQWLIQRACHTAEEEILANFAATMRQLHGTH